MSLCSLLTNRYMTNHLLVKNWYSITGSLSNTKKKHSQVKWCNAPDQCSCMHMLFNLLLAQTRMKDFRAIDNYNEGSIKLRIKSTDVQYGDNFM